MSVEVLTPDEVAKEMRLGNKKVYADLKAGICPGWQVGANWKVDRNDLPIYKYNLMEITRLKRQKDADENAEPNSPDPNATFRKFFPETLKLKKGARHAS